MKKVFLFLLFALLVVTMQAQPQGIFRNPIIPGYHPDPSVCRVGNDFYLVTSSFQYFPGVPIFHSTDLIHWEQLGNVLDRPSQLPLGEANSKGGIYAPTIRYHEGLYYMITTNVTSGGNFLVTATNPSGPWSEPIWLKQAGIDPSLFWDDGHCYMVSNPNSTITMCEIDPATGRQLTDSKPLWRGTGGRYPEAPHLYKKDGYFYLLIAEGGTELPHSITIARSKHIEGPYEACPNNPILSNCNFKGQWMQAQGTGHGDLIQAADGSWWIVFLAYRRFGGDHHHLGRETFLAPVSWPEGEWPVVNRGEAISLLLDAKGGNVDEKAEADNLPELVKQDIDYKMADVLRKPEWIHIQNPLADRYEVTLKGVLRLHASAPLQENKKPTFIGRRQESPNVEIVTHVTLNAGKESAEAGLSVYQSPDGMQNLSVVKSDSGYAVKMEARVMSIVDKKLVSIKGNSAYLRVSSDGLKYVYEYSVDGKTWTQLAAHNTSLLSSETVGGFTGVVIGMYAQGEPTVSADFSCFRYTEK